MIHVLPKEKMPVTRLPLDLLIANRVAYARKAEREGKGLLEQSQNEKSQGKKLSYREEQEELAATHTLILIPELDFEHCVYQLSESIMNEEGLSYAYQKMAGFMKLKQRPDVGVTVFVTPKWIFCCLLTAPYCKSHSGHPVYMNGLDFVGLFTLQTTDEVWPATAGMNLQ